MNHKKEFKTAIIDLDKYFDDSGEWKMKLKRETVKVNVKIIRSHTTPLKIGDNFLFGWQINKLEFDNMFNVIEIGSYFLSDSIVFKPLLFIAPHVKYISDYFMQYLKCPEVILIMRDLREIGDWFCHHAIIYKISCVFNNVSYIGESFMGACCEILNLDIFDSLEDISKYVDVYPPQCSVSNITLFLCRDKDEELEKQAKLICDSYCEKPSSQISITPQFIDFQKENEQNSTQGKLTLIYNHYF